MYGPWGWSYDRNMYERFKCFNVNFSLLKTIYVHLLVCYLNKLQIARCNDKDNSAMFGNSEWEGKFISLTNL